MASFLNFSSCYENITKLLESIKKETNANTSFIYDIFTQKLIQRAMNMEDMDSIEKINTIESIINTVLKNSKNLKKIEINFYDTDIEKPGGEKKLKKLIDKEKYNTPEYLYFYQQEQNKHTPISYSHLLALTLNIMPVHFYLNKGLNELYNSFYQFAKLLDCFIQIKEVPNFFEKYCFQIGISGLHIIDIEIILGFITNLLLLDFDNKLKPKYNDKGKIIEINNIFDLIFKWEYIDFNTILTSQSLSILLNKFIPKVNMASIMEILFKSLDKQSNIECMKLYKDGNMSISIYLAYLIRYLKKNIPVLSFYYMGYVDDLVEKIINNANKSKNIVGGAIFQEAFEYLSLADTFGIVSISGLVLLTLKILSKPVYYCMRAYVGKNKINISKNISYYELSNLESIKKMDDSVVINIISQKKYGYLASLILTMKMDNIITRNDKILISNNICKSLNGGAVKENNIFKPLTKQYVFTHKLIKQSSFKETGILLFDMLYLIILENKSIFKLYDNFFENFYTCNDYTINDDVIILSSVIINFISKLSPKSGNLIRKKLLNYIIIQNLYLLASSYKLSNPDAITNEDIFITDLLELCEKAGSVLSSSNFDDINELILACLGKENKLFNEQVTKTLSNIVNYNYITYREYLATTEISMISKNILFERLKSPVITYDKPVENININIKKEEEKEPEKTEKSSSVFEVNIDTIGKSVSSATSVAYTSATETASYLYKSSTAAAASLYNMFMTKKAPNVEASNNAVDEIIKTTQKSSSSSSYKLQEPENNLPELIDITEIEDTISKGIDIHLDNIKEQKISLKDELLINKEKINLFFQKLTEYILYATLIGIEDKLGFNVKNGLFTSEETIELFSHFKDANLNLLFETQKQKSFIRFISF